MMRMTEKTDYLFSNYGIRWSKMSTEDFWNFRQQAIEAVRDKMHVCNIICDYKTTHTKFFSKQ